MVIDLFAKVKRLWRRRKAISPVIATILLIALTVTAAAIVYFVVVPLLRGRGELVIFGYELEDTDATYYADKITTDIQNIGTAEVTISSVSITKDGEAISWALAEETYVIGSSERRDIVFEAASAADELGSGELIYVTLAYDNGKEISFEFKVPGKFSRFVLLYEEDFESGLPSGWTHTLFYIHGGGHHNLSDWVLAEESGNHYWHCTSNDCQFIILEDPLRNFASVNISYDLRTNDDDANGIIFRYDDSGEYAKFYIVWYTRDHPSPRNGPFTGETDYFDWATASDQIQPDKITVHYVEEDADGWNWYKIAEVDWNRVNNRWYSWRVIADGANMGLYIDNSNTPTLEWSDARISTGYVGLVSFANANSHYDNIYAWVTES
ncbi:MAG: hypothetical protein K9W42_10510 [Candidatus Heimdallarchaeota archaeon]|nr:hypothetical protein [Candidatus Heimdallarchaeota archaeon]